MFEKFEGRKRLEKWKLAFKPCPSRLRLVVYRPDRLGAQQGSNWSLYLGLSHSLDLTDRTTQAPNFGQIVVEKNRQVFLREGVVCLSRQNYLSSHSFFPLFWIWRQKSVRRRFRGKGGGTGRTPFFIFLLHILIFVKLLWVLICIRMRPSCKSFLLWARNAHLKYHFLVGLPAMFYNFQNNLKQPKLVRTRGLLWYLPHQN